MRVHVLLPLKEKSKPFPDVMILLRGTMLLGSGAFRAAFPFVLFFSFFLMTAGAAFDIPFPDFSSNDDDGVILPPSVAMQEMVRMDLGRVGGDPLTTFSPQAARQLAETESGNSDSFSANRFAMLKHRDGARLKYIHARRLKNDDDQTDSFHDVGIYGDYLDLGYYYAYLTVGTPAREFTAIVDTGSGLTVVPCTGCNGCGNHMDLKFDYSKSSTSKLLKCDDDQCHSGLGCSRGNTCSFRISYTEGSSLSGSSVVDRVCVGKANECSDANGAKRKWMTEFPIGCATTMTNLFRTQLADGIMGVSNDKTTTIIDALQSHHLLERDMFSLCFGTMGGRFVVGGYNESIHTGGIEWAPMASSGTFYEIDLFSVAVASSDVGKDTSTRVTVDTGTTFTYIPRSIASGIVQHVNEWCDSIPEACEGAKKASRVDPDSVQCYDFRTRDADKVARILASFPAITFKLRGASLAIPASQYMFPHDVENDSYYCMGFFTGRSFVLGMNMLQNFDVVFDRGEHRIGFARSHCGQVDDACADENCFLTADDINAQTILSNRPVAIIAFVASALVTLMCIRCCAKRARRSRSQGRRAAKYSQIEIMDEVAQGAFNGVFSSSTPMQRTTSIEMASSYAYEADEAGGAIGNASFSGDGIVAVPDTAHFGAAGDDDSDEYFSDDGDDLLQRAEEVLRQAKQQRRASSSEELLVEL